MIREFLDAGVTLVAVSKTKPVEDIFELYKLGQRDFGENYVQELTEKKEKLPSDIRWHFIGHLQSNKVKYIAPFVHLIHSIDNEKLLREVNKQAVKQNRVISCLLQMHIAKEETKFGMNEDELRNIMMNHPQSMYPNINLKGLMGMASNTTDIGQVRNEFQYLKGMNDTYFADVPAEEKILSIGMSGDYKLAIEEGSTLVRIGSLLFGARTYNI